MLSCCWATFDTNIQYLIRLSICYRAFTECRYKENTLTASSLPAQAPLWIRALPVSMTPRILSALACSSASKAWCFWCLLWDHRCTKTQHENHTDYVLRSSAGTSTSSCWGCNTQLSYIKINQHLLTLDTTFKAVSFWWMNHHLKHCVTLISNAN